MVSFRINLRSVQTTTPMSRNSIALISEIKQKIERSKELIKIEENKIEWVKSWSGVDSETYSEPQPITWENVEEAVRIVDDLESRINSLNETVWEGNELIVKINSFFA